MPLRREEEKWLREVRARLAGLAKEPETPLGDLRWLLDRCNDTLFRYQDDLQRASLRQFLEDIADFDEEFPGLLPADLVRPPS